MSSVWNGVKSVASTAVSWGKDICSGIANGVKSAASGVFNAVKSVASGIASFLHFSVPDEGPLTDFESWMPDFMEGLAKGIEENKGLIARAVKGVAETMKLDGLVPDMKSSVNASINGGNDDAAVVNLSQPILLDGKTITMVVSQIQYSQGKASLRNLGTV